MAKLKSSKKEVGVVAEVEMSSTIQFDCLAVTNVNVYPFKEGPTLGKTKAIASVV